MEQKIKIGNAIIDDPIVVEYSYLGQHFHAAKLSESLQNHRISIAEAIAENSECVNDYLPIAIVGTFEEADAFICEYQRENHLPEKDLMACE